TLVCLPCSHEGLCWPVYTRVGCAPVRSCSVFLFFSLLRPPPRSTPFPYTTLFRSDRVGHGVGAMAGIRVHAAAAIAQPPAPLVRSEEHTSELQSRENLVCRLLLEKKKVLHRVEEREQTQSGGGVSHRRHGDGATVQ